MNWQATLDELSLQMTRATFNAWLRDATFLQRDGDIFVIGVRSQAAKEWLENRMQGVVERALATVVEEKVKVSFVSGVKTEMDRERYDDHGF
jgi:chromosomal replication initiator protein